MIDETIASPAAPSGSHVEARATDSLVLAIVGSGGDGVALLGDLLLRMAAERGLYGILVQSYGPQIRGGESAVLLRIAREETHYEGDETDLLLCFRLGDLRRFQGSIKLHPRSIVVLDAADTTDPPEWLGLSELQPFRHPFATIVDGQEVPGEPKNMMGLALLCRALGWAPEHARQAIEKRFAHKPQVVARNLATFDRAWATEAMPRLPALHGHGVPLQVETGNEAVARGAIAAGLKFFAGYPITPSSEIMETLIDELPPAGGRVVQAEDEIAALGMVIGASFGGVPAMTATSGPGLSLMTEMLGLSSMAEIPTVVVDCQRVGPATGIPSRTEQSDLYHAVYGGHGDFPRAVLGVFDTVHARDVMFKAFHLAERYQLPVLVLSDAYVAQRRQIRDPAVDRPEPPQRRAWKPGDAAARFDVTGAHGVGAFRIPGTEGGTYLAAGIEHTPDGNPTSDTVMHHTMNTKRFKKLDGIAAETGDWFRTLGRADAPLGIIAWGSMYGLLYEWVRENPEYRVFLPEIIHPFPLRGLSAWRQGLGRTWTLELSFQRQFHRYLSSLTDLTGVIATARSGGLPLSTAELSRMLTEASS
jgi:2-oxoglutarate ferredoxin oxidoreductase subunit alpha